MKYIYTLLFSFFILNQVFAENWVKFELKENSIINKITSSYPDYCFENFNYDNTDTIDLDCIKNIKYLSLELGKYGTSNDTFSLKEIEILLENMSTNTFLYIKHSSNNFFKNKNIHIDWKLDNNELYKKLIGLSISFPQDSIFNYNFPPDIEYVKINTLGKYLEIDSLNKIEKIEINYEYDYSWASIEVHEELELNINNIENMNSFRSGRYIKNRLPNLPKNISDVAVAIKNENKDNIIQDLKQYTNLQQLGFILLKPVDSIDLKDITKAKNISFNVILVKSSINHVTINEECRTLSSSLINIKDLKVNQQLEGFYFNGDYIEDQINLPVFSDNLKRLELNNIQNLSNPINLPKYLDSLYLSNLNINCLPIFPQSLKSFMGYGIKNVKCIPNETPWVRATSNWPLCTDAQFVCDEDFQIVNGKVFLDLNNNGILDEQDIPLPNAVISTDKNEFAKSTEDGTYGIILREEGNYILSAKLNHPHSGPSTPISSAINYTLGEQIDSINFLIPIENKNDVRINGTHIVARPGMSTNVYSFIENLSLENKENLTVKILQPSDWSFRNATPENYIISNDTIIWNNISISSLSSKSFSLNTILPATAEILGESYQYEMWVENEGDITPEDNYYSIIDTVIGSYDPNDKIVNHTTLSTELSNSEELIYTIRFQNTGTDTAFKVVIIDTIIGNLDPTSIRILGTSHNYTWNYTGNGIATFVFDNILLPDSNVNEPGSHGFVTLALRPNKDLAVGDSIYNKAGIYFDVNEPIYTNQANTRIITVTPIYNHSNIPLSIYPNPTKDFVRIEWNVTEPTTLILSDISAKIIKSEGLYNGLSEINVSQLPKGIYIVQLQSGKNIAISKLIIQ